ncbi:glycoside hydrolase family 31 protein [Viridothelium virens]|uniref:alpha-glucosidase n=1 Tax=Viridothelium virens TaxID=1048519 RepID=A0A6A6H038_VIRVR|nr:glycoside hydrolase family 31 protein [Viridothelium virens]
MRSSNGPFNWTAVFLFLSCLYTLFTPALTVKKQDFKTCDQSGFCKRNRAYSDTAISQSSSWTSPYTLDAQSIAFKGGQLTGIVLKNLPQSGENLRLPLTINFLESGLARVSIDEEKRQKGEIELRHGSKARKERYNEAEKWAIVGGQQLSKGAAVSKDSEEGTTKVLYGPASGYEAIIRHRPFVIDFKRDGETHIQFNERGLLNVEHWRPKIEKEPPKEGEENKAEEEQKIVDPAEDESTWWEETFGGNTDSKPKGPESVALDVSFPGYEHVYGVPEHTGPLSLLQTRGGEGNHDDPYRLYNSDVFEYEMDSPMTLYGAIPFMQAHRAGSTVGVLWLNAAETWIDIVKSKLSANPLSLGIKGTTTTQTHWFSEAGILDVFVFLGPTPQAISKSYGELTGYTQLPQQFAIAYHQCRWNYVTDEDVKDVDRKFDKHSIPYDVIWLDIEYTEEKKYFTWDGMTFPDPLGMQKQLDEHERKLVAIIDPHIKNTANYWVKDELVSKDLAIKNKDGNIWDGWCWPGSSYWVDCFNPAAIEWWKSLFTYDRFKGSARNLFIWNDMNEPSVFNGPETTSPKDNMHHGNWEHRDLHNINGLTFVNATYAATLQRSKSEAPQRPFILTRSFYAGSQRMGAMWTGDNQALWSHLKASLPMVLNNGVSGFPFAGADVGGFFGNPEKDLLVRWYQAGAFYPFFRAHAHIDTRRREPYLAGSPYREIITKALRLRYALLPSWYTAFREAHTEGWPIVRPNWWVHPSDPAGFALDKQMYLGSTGLLVAPVLEEGATSVDVYLADETPYYDYWDFELVKGRGMHTLDAPLEKLPLLMRAGHVFPRRDRPRRSSGLMRYDPFTLVVVLGTDAQGAEGTLYLDDGESFDYEQGAFIHRKFTYDAATQILRSEDIGEKGKKSDAYAMSMQGVRVERVIVVGAPAEWKGKEEVDVAEEGAKASAGTRKVDCVFHEASGKKAAWAVVRDPRVEIGKGWKIDFSSGARDKKEL